MKPLRDQTYYEVLEVPVDATSGEIQRAYDLARLTYGKNSIASYSLFSTAELGQILEKVEQAYHTLIDPQKRKDYDHSVGVNREEAKPRSERMPTLFRSELPEPYLSQQELSGKDLKKIREGFGISLPEISERTRISVSYLLRLEEDSVRLLPPETYLRSYVTQYASALGLEPKPVVDRYLAYFRRTRK